MCARRTIFTTCRNERAISSETVEADAKQQTRHPSAPQHQQSAAFFTAKPKSVLLSDKIACCRIHFAFVSFAGSASILLPFLYFPLFCATKLSLFVSLAHTHSQRERAEADSCPFNCCWCATSASIDPAQYESQIFSKLNSDPSNGRTDGRTNKNSAPARRRCRVRRRNNS